MKVVVSNLVSYCEKILVVRIPS